MKKTEFSCARDGLTIRGTEFLPEGKAEGEKLPCAIVSHGFMANESSVKKYAEWFASKGWAAYTFDFNGGCIKGKSDGRTTDMTVLTEREDLKAVIAYVKGLPYINTERLLLMGCSQGGFVSALTAAELKSEIFKLVLFYPALCIPDDARRGQMMFAKFDPQNVPETVDCGMMKLGHVYPESVREMDPYTEIAGYRGPVLIVHGMEDKIVNVSYSKRAHEMYTAQKTGDAELPAPSIQFVTIENAGHGFKENEDRIALFALGQFLHGMTEIFSVHVSLTGKKITRTGFRKKHRSLPFEGFVTGYLQGEIGKGFSDEQEMEGAKTVHCCADYVVTGTDYLGAPCQMHIVNEKNGDDPWHPTITTDSKALGFLETAEKAEILEMRDCGPIVHVFARVPREAVKKV